MLRASENERMILASENERMILAVVAWHLWISRNGTRNGDPMRSPQCVASQALAYAEMIELHLFKPEASTRRDTSFSAPRWSPLPEGSVFINTDAAIFSSSRQMGVGVVIRNHLGECVAACSELLNEVTTPEITEVLAVRRALSLADGEGFGKVQVVSDCLSVIQRIESTTIDRSPVGVIIQDIKSLAFSFEAISFKHVRRHCNESAHILARLAESFISSTFRNFTPECIRKTLYYDLL
jgi:ribonuclease HI